MLEITGFSHYDKLSQSRVGPLLCLPVWWRALLVVGWCFFLPKPLAWPVDGTEHIPSEHTGECGRAQKHPLRCYFSKTKNNGVTLIYGRCWQKWMKTCILCISLKIKLGRSLSSLPGWLAGGLYDNFSVKDNLFGITYTSSCFHWKELLHDHLCHL